LPFSGYTNSKIIIRRWSIQLPELSWIPKEYITGNPDIIDANQVLLNFKFDLDKTERTQRSAVKQR